MPASRSAFAAFWMAAPRSSFGFFSFWLVSDRVCVVWFELSLNQALAIATATFLPNVNIVTFVFGFDRVPFDAVMFAVEDLLALSGSVGGIDDLLAAPLFGGS